jgi:CheY-like chemotaxis protein
MSNQETILIIEADQVFANETTEVLKKSGYTVSVVTNGMDGVKAMYNKPSLIFLDITLTDVDSYEILSKKSVDPVIRDIPVFLVSSQGVPINMRRVPANSVVEFIMAMHSAPAELVDKVNRFFGHETVSTPSANNEKSIKIMWVEDDKLIGTILSKKLISSGFDLFHAKTGEEAIEALKDAKPDVIVLDLLLPGVGGFDVLQAINKDNGLRNIPVMILSNLSKPTDVERAKLLGAKKFLIKAATSLEQIVKEIHELVGR